jgi:hypothetical protein
MKKIRIEILFTLCLLLLVGCRSTFNMKSESKNFKTAQKIFDDNYSKNGNAFLYSVGTIGNKYIWTHSGNKKIDLVIIDLSGKVERKQFTNQENWTSSIQNELKELECLSVLDGDILKIKFMNDQGKIFEQSLIHKFECLSKQKDDLIYQIVKEIKLLGIR